MNNEEKYKKAIEKAIEQIDQWNDERGVTINDHVLPTLMEAIEPPFTPKKDQVVAVRHCDAGSWVHRVFLSMEGKLYSCVDGSTYLSKIKIKWEQCRPLTPEEKGDL